MTGTVPPFDVCGPLPTGITVLEASAGTGKTFTIAALAARFVAAGTPLDQLLLVTFTRMATGELRDRVRERLVSAERGLARRLQGVAPPGDDDVLLLLATGPDDVVEQRRRRLARALSDFDAATISTIHGFCEHVLAGLGVTGDVDRDVEFQEDPRDLVEEVVADLYVRRFHAERDEPAIAPEEARRIGRLAIANSDANLVPLHAPADSVEAMRVRLAHAVRAELERRKRRGGLITYDDLLGRLATTLADERRGPAACARLRGRYRIALVDEFQDTDPVQWEIFRRIFGAPPCTLVLIGDPKQAIYAFRGADVYAYLEAAQQAETKATLGVNWRSDQGLIDAYDRLFGNAMLGHTGIRYREVRAAEADELPRLVGAPVAAPLRVRLVDRDASMARLTPSGYAPVDLARAHVAADVARDIAALLSSAAHVVARGRDGSEHARETVGPQHVAVLVHRHRDAAAVRDALDAVDVPAVINGAGSVFATPSARDWLRLLEALERPTSPGRARAAALTAFFGWDARRVATAQPREWEQVHALLHRWSDVLAARGVASLQETVTTSQGLPGRVLAQAEGERIMTDLRHAGELLHAAATGEKLGVTALAAWLRRRMAEAEADTASEERSRRLESDSEAVQVLTIHRSKGLEFPIVYCPYLWDAPWIPEDQPPVFHDPADGDRRTIDLAGKDGAGWQPYVEEERGQDLRLAYVALTRARHQAVVWWAGVWQSHESPLGRLLFARQPDGAIPAATWSVPDDTDAFDAVTELAAGAAGRISVEWTSDDGAQPWPGPAPAAVDLDVARFERELDAGWRRTSYSAITAGSHEPRVASEPEQPPVFDEDMPPPPAAAVPQADDGEARLRAVASPLAAVAGGADVGTFIHRVLEHTDFAADDLDAELGAHVADQRRRRPLETGSTPALVAGLRAAIETPLGPLVDGLRLRDVGRADRVDELAFELPLVGGDTPPDGMTVDLDAVADLLRRHLPDDDPLAGYAGRLGDPSLRRQVRGYLSGSLDLVVRLPGESPRFTVIDHKTNWLGFDGLPLSAWHYRPAALADAMQRAHYPLQALLYTVALHRYLRWRLPGYTAEENLAGVLYLFVRGMSGPECPVVGGQPCGVFAWRPPAALVTALSDMLDAGVPV